ncbi:hypothetical protein FZC33_15905 [Labrys sp. KNU-23]|uniref:hypothetical protein n=1 Tax=Labrys sp. KNU-23 TaxID=2789216 RepID=UPI0011EE1D69|nr:hypothetical protein [Labrys sp. KNU-23]QEN87711.1 hypothetical protein FZC33_15905 [Labrys sp. KNU-23]
MTKTAKTEPRSHAAEADHEEEILALAMESGILCDLIEKIERDIKVIRDAGLLSHPIDTDHPSYMSYMVRGRAAKLWSRYAA